MDEKKLRAEILKKSNYFIITVKIGKIRAG